METSTSSILPHGAKGIDLGEFVVEFRSDKMVAIRKSSGDHFTLQFGENSGVIDLHRTWNDADGRKHRETIFAIHRNRIPAVLEEFELLVLKEFGSWPSVLIHFVRPLHLGLLGHRHIGIAWGILPVEEEHIGRITLKSPRKRLIIDPVKYREDIYVPEYLDEIWDMPDGQFSLWKRRRMVGIGMKVRRQHHPAKLYWFKMRDWMRFLEKMQEPLLQALSRHAIPADEYRLYDFLCPKAD